MTPTEKAFHEWWSYSFPGERPDEDDTGQLLIAFEAGWRAAESRYWCGHKPTKQTPTEGDK